MGTISWDGNAGPSRAAAQSLTSHMDTPSSAQQFGISHQRSAVTQPSSSHARGAAAGGAGRGLLCTPRCQHTLPRGVERLSCQRGAPGGAGRSPGCPSGPAAAQGMEPRGVSVPPPACHHESVPVQRRDAGRMQVGGHRRGSGHGETAQPAGSNLLIAVLLKYFRSVTLSRLLQARIRAPAGSLGCGCKCSLLLP